MEKEDRDIVLSATVFASGVGTAELAGGGEAAALSGLLASGLLAFLLCRRKSGGDLALVLLMWFSVGFFCFSSNSLCTLRPGISPSTLWMEKALERLPFRSGVTCPLLTALLTGNRSALGREVTEAFRGSGASHILALSGLHLGIIYGISSKVLAVLGNTPLAFRIRAAFSIMLCGAYTLMTGASPSIVRAFLFIALHEAGKLLPGRSHSPVRIWCLALIIQLSLNPGALLSVGFQLSYLAMLGIYTLFPVLKGWYPDSGRADPMRKIWQAAALSTSCQLFTGPLAFLKFGTFPKYFLVTNLISLPLTELLIIAGVLTLALSAFLPSDCALVDFLAGICDAAADFLCGALSVISRM